MQADTANGGAPRCLKILLLLYIGSFAKKWGGEAPTMIQLNSVAVSIRPALTPLFPSA